MYFPQHGDVLYFYGQTLSIIFIVNPVAIVHLSSLGWLSIYYFNVQIISFKYSYLHKY
jgi:hypothetical protein